MNIKEEWRPVLGYEGIYEVSDQGNVKSLSRKDERGHSSGTSTIYRIIKNESYKGA